MWTPWKRLKKDFSELSEQEILALAIQAEIEDGRVYRAFAEGLLESYPASAQVFFDMEKEESQHRDMLIELHRQKFGESIPLIRREDVRGFITRKPVWLMRPLPIEIVRRQAESMEFEAARFYRKAADRAQDASIKKLLSHLADMEQKHEDTAMMLEQKHLGEGARESEDEAARRAYVLQVVQPGLLGLMDGSVSTLAPVFAAAFVTQNSHDALIVGLAASLGAGISMGLAEALSDDGSLTGRGSGWMRGVITGLMTTVGGLGHTLPYLLSHFWTATILAIIITVIELIIIAWIRWKYMDTPFWRAMVQIVLGGILVTLTGFWLGHS